MVVTDSNLFIKTVDVQWRIHKHGQGVVCTVCDFHARNKDEKQHHEYNARHYTYVSK